MATRKNDCSPPAIHIHKARTHNLKEVTVSLPHKKFIVITGLSGSGKSSLAFDTLFADGQRRYIESMSTYARQFLGKIAKPPVDYITGILPSIGMRQKTRGQNPRARIGTTTDITPYLRLLFARIGQTISPVSGKQVTCDSVEEVVDELLSLPAGSKLLLLSPLAVPDPAKIGELLKIEMTKGFSRIFYAGELLFIEEFLARQKAFEGKSAWVMIDRCKVAPGQELRERLSDAVQTAFFEGKGACRVVINGEEKREFSDRFERDGITFTRPTPHFFSLNHPLGACPECKGLGRRVELLREKVIPRKHLSVEEGAVYPWKSPTMSAWKHRFLKDKKHSDFPAYQPYKELAKKDQKRLWKAIDDFFVFLDSQQDKVQYRVLKARYHGRTMCSACTGTGLRKEAGYVKVGGKSLIELLPLSIKRLRGFFDGLVLCDHEQAIAELLLEEITSRLSYLEEVGLGYLTLNRLTHTLSGGEYQRLRLASMLGSTLVDTLYILDEPTVGLHPKNTQQLVEVLLCLQRKGNTVVVVEHEEAMMRAADQLLDIGPGAGSHGGQVVFQGSWEEMLEEPERSHTVRYLTGRDGIPLPTTRRHSSKRIQVKGATLHNLKNIHVSFPLGVLSVVTGVSGSGKSSLVKGVLLPSLAYHLGLSFQQVSHLKTIRGAIHELADVVHVGQHPMGKSSRSNPMTYLKAYEGIRRLFAAEKKAIQRAYDAGFFSFNLPGGRCEKCTGEGEIKVEMQFMADVYLTCEDCQGKRFKEEALEIRFQGKNIAEVLEMTVDESLTFFAPYRGIVQKLKPLQEVGLGYLQLGQSSSTLSGGEAQRVKLSAYLSRGVEAGHTLFIFDEPTTGLHLHDTKKLLKALHALVDQGHTVIVIEHNTEVIKCADWVIDLGPEGGEEGGYLLFAGTPEEMIQLTDNSTAHYLREKMLSQPSPSPAAQQAKS